MSITMGQLATRFAKAGQQLPGAMSKELRTLGQVGVGYVKQEIQAAHAVDTGTMLNSTTMEAVSKDSILIGPTVKYAPYVALGTSRMPARPFHITAARRLQADIKQGDILREIGLA